MKIKDLPGPYLQVVAGAANLKPGTLRSLFGEVDVEMREDAETKGAKPVVVENGVETGLRDHLAGLEDGAEILAALDSSPASSDGETTPLNTSRLDNWARDKYAHALPKGARVDTQEPPKSTGSGLNFPAMGGPPPSTTSR